MGRIPDGHSFAGQALVPPWSGGTLFECADCGLGFRHPIRPQSDYENLYERAAETVWPSGPLRPDQLRIKSLIESRASAKSVLDVGCYDGGLLNALGARFGKFGVEASTRAAQVARERGVEILGSKISGLASIRQRFDVVCAVDVIEHLPDPAEFARQLLRLLNPGGLMLLSSGAIDTAAWRVAGGGYWYCSIAEHISFISLKWARQFALDRHLTLCEVDRFRYAELGVSGRAAARRQFGVELAKAHVKRLLALLPGNRYRDWKHAHSVGGIGAFADHIVLGFVRSEPGTGPTARAVSTYEPVERPSGAPDDNRMRSAQLNSRRAAGVPAARSRPSSAA